MGYFTTSVSRIEKAVAAVGIPIQFTGVWNTQLERAFEQFANKAGIVTDSDHPVSRGRPGAGDVQVGPRALRDQVMQRGREFEQRAQEAHAGTDAPVGASTPRREMPGGTPRVGPNSAPYVPTILENDLMGLSGLPPQGVGVVGAGGTFPGGAVVLGVTGLLVAGAVGYVVWKSMKG